MRLPLHLTLFCALPRALTPPQAMKGGDMILVDELNLAEDAVLERLNRQEGGRGLGQGNSRSAGNLEAGAAAVYWDAGGGLRRQSAIEVSAPLACVPPLVFG